MRGLVENWKVVLLSLIVAATFWLFNALNKDYNARLDYPIEFKFSNDSLVIMRPLPETVELDVSGIGWNLFKKTFLLNAKPIVIRLDNPTDIKYLPRASIVPLISDQLEGLNINYVVTDTLHFDIEKKVSKVIDILVDSANIKLEEHYRITSPVNVNPDTAQVIGAQRFIQNIPDIYTLLIEETITGDYDDEIEIELPENSYLRAIPYEINVTFDITKFIRDSVLVTPEIINFPPDAYILDTSVYIHYTFQEGDYEEISTSDFNLLIDYEKIITSDSSIQLIITGFPQLANEFELKPKKVKVSYE